MEKKEKAYCMTLAGVSMNCRFREEGCAPYFGRWLSEARPGLPCIALGAAEDEQIRRDFPPEQRGLIAERKVLSYLASDVLVRYRRVIVHSAAFALDGGAWLLTAPSGTGKSTQYRNLKRLHSNEVTIISGDAPILEFRENDIIVHPSPWNGKEGWGSDTSAPLAGLVLLEQAEENDLVRMTPPEAVVPVFQELHTFLKTDEQVRRLFRLEERLLTSVPLWRFRNRGDMASSERLYGMIREERHEL